MSPFVAHIGTAAVAGRTGHAGRDLYVPNVAMALNERFQNRTLRIPFNLSARSGGT